MQQTIWEWLGIEKTTDKSRIRKAYAEQVKRYHPEEFPQEAQELRKAYKSAMALASDARIVPGWAEDNIAQEISFAVRDSGRVLPEFSHFESQAESDAGTKPKYDCPKPVPPGEQFGPESEPEYTYQKPVSPGGQSGPESELEPEYTYQKPMPPGGQSGPESETEPEYTYKKNVPPNTQSETDSEGESEWVYRKSVPPDAQSEADLESEPEYVYRRFVSPDEQSEREYSFASPKLSRAVAMRIADMIKRMGDIYGTEHRNSAEKWRQVFADYPYPGDMRDVQAVWEIFAAIEPMSRLNGSTWDILQTELFRYRDDTASWQLLQERFDAVRRSYGAFSHMPAKKPPKKTSLTEFCAVFLIIMSVIALPLCIKDKVQEYQQRSRFMEFQQMISEQIQLETPTISVSRGILQSSFTKESPFEMDLNQDDWPDHMYYDPGKGLFMVALYDASTGKYNFYGSVDKYLEENPDMDSIKGLDYFTKGGKSLR